MNHGREEDSVDSDKGSERADPEPTEQAPPPSDAAASEAAAPIDAQRSVKGEGTTPASGDVTPDPSPLDVLDALTQERDDYLETLRRLQADFENYRKRNKADTDMAIGRATERIVDRLLPVLDTFEMALSHEADPNASPLAKLHDQLLSALESEGLERLHPLDAAFDPADAEAVMHEEGDPGQDGPIVVQVLRAGYRWKGRVMRAAMVKVRG